MSRALTKKAKVMLACSCWHQGRSRISAHYSVASLTSHPACCGRCLPAALTSVCVAHVQWPIQIQLGLLQFCAYPVMPAVTEVNTPAPQL
jgi:hypothetical protein